MIPKMLKRGGAVRAIVAGLILASSLGTGQAIAQAKTEAPAVVEGAAPAVIERIKVHSDSVAGNLEGNTADRDVIVVLPPSYRANPGRRYPVVYALHGYSIGAEQWASEIHVPQVIEGAFAKGVPEMIVVLPDSKTLHNGSMYSTSVTTGDFENFVARDLVAYIDSHYRTIPDRKSRGLVGHSMGGYGATRIGFKHADTFGALYLMSPCCMPARPGGGPLTPEMLAGIAKLKPTDDMSGLPFQVRGLLAMSSAWSPNPGKAPLYVDVPYEQDGKPIDAVFARWTANSPFAMLDQYVPNLKRYAAIALDVGDRDGLVTDTGILHQKLLDYGIANSFEIYEGDHTNRVAFRFQENVLPFFGKNLAATEPAPPAPSTTADDSGTGPFPAIMEVDATLPRQVIYRPENLKGLGGKKLGVYVWGNGACTDDAASVRNHLMEIASHGYIVLAPGFVGADLERVRAATAAEPGKPAGLAGTTIDDLRNGLDWALAQNGKSGSKYRGLIDPNAVAASGFSCGGIQALELATSDKRVKAIIVNNSGLMPDEQPALLPQMELPKAALDSLRTPVLYVMGGPTDIAWANGRDDFERIGKVPAVMVSLPVGHGGTYHDPHGGAAASLNIDWLEWQLRGDKSAARTFMGDNCRVCGVPGWSIERKGF